MPTKLRMAIKRERPGWWTQEGVLSRLQSGAFILQLCQAAVDEMAEVGIVISPGTLRAEVGKWTESATWGEQFRAALALWKKTSSGAMALSKAWHDDFLAAMEAHGGNAEKAAKMAGVGYGVVLAVQDPRNQCYDPEFVEKFRIAEASRIARMRERYMDTAENGDGKLAQRAQERMIETALPALHGQKQELHVSGLLKHDHEHAHEHEHNHQHRHLHAMAPDQAREVVLASQDRMRRITAGRARELPATTADSVDSERVIDVTPKTVVDRAVLRDRVEGFLGSRGVAALEGAIEEAMDKAVPIIRESIEGNTLVKPS